MNRRAFTALVTATLLSGLSVVLPLPAIGAAVPPCGTVLFANTFISGLPDNCATPFAYKIGFPGITVICGGGAITGNGSNIGIWNPGFPNVDIKNCILKGFKVGVYITGAVGGTLKNNVASNNLADGFVLLDVTLGTLTQNVATGNGLNGFNITDSSYLTITHNSGSSNAQNGFSLLNDTHSRFSENKAGKNTLDGFKIASSPYNSFETNAAIYNHADGYDVLPGSDSNMFETNQAMHNRGIGFDSAVSPRGYYYGNTAAGNSYGFVLGNLSNYCFASRNTASVNSEDGFLIYQGADHEVLSHNFARGNRLNGFEINSTDSDEVSYNVAYSNAASGFALNATNNVFLYYNTATSNGGDGFGVSGGVKDYIYYNFAASNALSGILLNNLSSNNQLYFNTAWNNGNDGILLDSTTSLNQVVFNRTPGSGAAPTNTPFGRADYSAGAGTLGTANYWWLNIPAAFHVKTFPLGLP